MKYALVVLKGYSKWIHYFIVKVVMDRSLSIS